MTQTLACTRTDRIRSLNDAFRKTFVGGTLLLTEGVATLDPLVRKVLLEAVRSFTAFDQDNDPHHEHDFGAIDCDGSEYFFKIDTYDRAMVAHSPDAADPAVTTRVLTIMRADEY